MKLMMILAISLIVAAGSRAASIENFGGWESMTLDGLAEGGYWNVGMTAFFDREHANIPIAFWSCLGENVICDIYSGTSDSDDYSNYYVNVFSEDHKVEITTIKIGSFKSGIFGNWDGMPSTALKADHHLYVSNLSLAVPADVIDRVRKFDNGALAQMGDLKVGLIDYLETDKALDGTVHLFVGPFNSKSISAIKVYCVENRHMYSIGKSTPENYRRRMGSLLVDLGPVNSSDQLTSTAGVEHSISDSYPAVAHCVIDGKALDLSILHH